MSCGLCPARITCRRIEGSSSDIRLSGLTKEYGGVVAVAGIFRNLFRPKELPIVPAVAVILIILSIIPVYLAHRLSSDDSGLTPGRGGGATSSPGMIAEAEATAAH